MKNFTFVFCFFVFMRNALVYADFVEFQRTDDSALVLDYVIQEVNKMESPEMNSYLTIDIESDNDILGAIKLSNSGNGIVMEVVVYHSRIHGYGDGATRLISAIEFPLIVSEKNKEVEFLLPLTEVDKKTMEEGVLFNMASRGVFSLEKETLVWSESRIIFDDLSNNNLLKLNKLFIRLIDQYRKSLKKSGVNSRFRMGWVRRTGE